MNENGCSFDGSFEFTSFGGLSDGFKFENKSPCDPLLGDSADFHLLKESLFQYGKNDAFFFPELSLENGFPLETGVGKDNEGFDAIVPLTCSVSKPPVTGCGVFSPEISHPDQTQASKDVEFEEDLLKSKLSAFKRAIASLSENEQARAKSARRNFQNRIASNKSRRKSRKEIEAMKKKVADQKSEVESVVALVLENAKKHFQGTTSTAMDAFLADVRADLYLE